LHAAVPIEDRMQQYGCDQEGTKASSRRDADAARDARGRCAPRRPRPRARSVRRSRAPRTHVSRSSRRNRSNVPRSQITPARMRTCARCRSRAARDSRSIVSSSACPRTRRALHQRRHPACPVRRSQPARTPRRANRPRRVATSRRRPAEVHLRERAELLRVRGSGDPRTAPRAIRYRSCSLPA
jgi:hypothetical protein